MTIYTKLFTYSTKKGKLFFQAIFIVLLILLSFQRVLSPQFFIWCIPGFSILCLGKKHYCYIVMIIFATTSITYDIGFLELANMNPLFIYITFIRNLLLVLITLMIVYKFFCKRNNPFL